MIRAFQNDKRIATAVVLTEGKILQVYPAKQMYESEEAFKAAYPEHEFKTEEREAAQQRSEISRRMKNAQAHVLAHTSLPRDSDTALQRVVRQIYFQTGTRDSIRSTAKDWQSSYYGARVDPGIYVQDSKSNIITPVYFNRKSGLVLFSHKVQNECNPEGLRYFRKDRGDLIPIVPEFYTQGPGQKAIVYDHNYNATNYKVFEQLRTAGFHIVHYMNNGRISLDVLKAMHTMIPNLGGVLMIHMYSDELWVYPSLEKLNSNSWWHQSRISAAKWIEDNK